MKTEEMICELRRLEEAHKDDFVGTCETNWSLMCRDVANRLEELLAAQELRLMTWPEVIGAAIECKPLYIEVKDSEDKEPGDDRWAMVTQYKDSITNGMIRAMSSYVTSEILFAEDYGKRWRCWTSRPNEKRRAETPWDC